MRNRILLILIFVLNNFLIHAQTQDKWVKGEVYIKIKEGSFKQARVNSSKEREVTASDLAVELPFLEKNKAKFKLKEVLRPFYFSESETLRRIYHIKMDDDKKIDSIIILLQKNPMIEYIERIQYLKKYSSNLKNPELTLIDRDWHLQKIKSYEAWNIAPKAVANSNVIVAVIDDAIQTSHPDLIDNLVSSTLWRDIADNDNNPNPIADAVSHGTHVAGIIAARNGNNIGATSVSNNRVLIMPIKVEGDATNEINTLNCLVAIAHAADNGANIINMSFGIPSNGNTAVSLIYADAVAYANSKNCVLVGGAGNENNEHYFYPASNNFVISVSNTDINDIRFAGFTNGNMGSSFNNLVDISAPGSEIFSCVPTNSYDNMWGTSMSSPLVAGAIGFLKSYLPYATSQELETLIKNSADNIDAANPDYIGKLGAGRLNLLKAVQMSMTNNAPTLIPNLSNSKNFTWSSVSGCHAFVVERAFNSIGPFTQLGYQLPTLLSYTDNTAQNNTAYYYRVRCSNSNTYSNVLSTSCPPTNEIVSFYNNSYSVVQKPAWFKSTSMKAFKWNLVDKTKTGAVTVGEASKSVILAAKSIWPSKYTTLPKQCFDQNPYGAYVDEMKRIGVLSQSATSNDALTLDILSDMVYKVILDAGATKDAVLSLPSQFTKANPYFTGTPKAKKLADTRTIRFYGTDPQGRQIKTSDQLVYVGQTISRGLFCQVLTGAYESKHYLVNNRTLPQGRLAAQLTVIEDDVNDFTTIGYKPEYTDDVPDGEPTMQITGASEIIQSGAQWWIEVNPTLLGNNQQYYLTVEGALQGARLDPYTGYSNFRRIYFTAPIVTTETILNMVIYGSSDDGKAVEIYKQFKVVPIPNNGCIALLTPNISFDMVAGSFTTTKTCTIRNGSTTGTANISFQITGPNASSFSRNPASTSLSPNQTYGVDVSCNASTVGTYTASLEITQTGLSGCPQKITVPLLANITAATSEPGLTWIEPLVEGTVFYSGSNIPASSNNLSVNNIFSGTEFRYQASGGNLTTINSCTITSQATVSFPEGMFSKSVRFWARKKDCGTNTAIGNWVLTPPMTVMPTPNININVIYPNGTEILTGNQMYEIKWSGSSTSPVTLQYSTDGGVTFPNTIASNLTASAGKYNWIVPILSSYQGSVRIKIISGSFSDVSDGNFGIKPPLFLSPKIQQNCDDKGQILITSSGGKYPHTYLVTPGNYTTTDIRALNAGTYTIKVTDATGESLQTTVTMPAYTPRDFSYTKTDATCGGKNGSIKITGFSSGYVPNRIFYSKNGVDGGSFDTEINNLEAGRYTVSTYQDFLGLTCGVEKIIDINPDNNFSVASVVTDASCGQSNGAITLTASSAATFLWSNGATTNSVSGLQQGTQFVTVRNTATGCNLPLSYEVGLKPTVFISSGQNFNNAVSNQMAVINNAILFIKPNSYSLLKYSAIDFTFQQEIDFTTDFSYYYSNYKLKEIHKKYGAESNVEGLYNPVISLVLNTSGTYDYLASRFNTSTNNLTSDIIPFTNSSNRPFVYTGASNSLLSLNNSNTINHITSNTFVTGCYNHLQTTSDGYGSTLAYAIQSCSNKVDELIFDTQFRVGRTYTTSGTPSRAYSNYNFPTCFVTVANSAFQLEVYKSDFTLNYIVPLPTQMGLSSNLTNEFTGDSEYLLISNSAGKVAVFSKTRKSFIDVVDIGMSINKVGYDYATKRFFFLNGTTLKYITITEPNLSVSSTKTDVACTQNGSIALTVLGGGTPTYSWSNGATTKDISNLTVGTYTVTVTPSVGGCAVRGSIKIENIGIVPTATVSNPANKTSFCVGESVQLVANQGTGLTYQWQKDGVDLNGATQQTYYVTTTGSYRVKVKNSTGCETTSTATSLTANPLPTASITPLSSTSICEGNTVTLRANTATNQSYVWLKNDEVLHGQTSQDLVANLAGSYQLVTILNGCSNISSSTIVTVNALPTTPSVTSTTINSSQTATLAATGCTGTVTWYANATGGTGLSTGASYTTPALTTTTTYYASCTVSGCESVTRGSGTVTVNSACTPPAAPNFPNQPTLGSAGSFTLNYSTICSGGTLKWYDAQTAGNLLYTGGTYTTPVLYSATNYYVSCTINDCESTRGQLTINYSPLPCVGNQNSSGNFGTFSLQTNGTITSTSTIMTGARTKFFAGQSITLNPGFKTSTSSIFRAEIQNCVSNSGLIAYYPFNGNANDESGNLKHATNNGATLTTDRFGYSQKAYYFDGVSNWINTPLVQSNLTEYTISAWVQPNFTNNQEYVIIQNRGASPGSGKGFTLHYQNSSNRWGFALDGDATYIGKQAPYPNNTNWVHVVATWSAGSATSFSPSQFNLYINGILQSSAVSQNIGTATVPSTPAGTAAIGRSEAWNSYFKGKIDELRIYNRALNTTEVKALYNFEK